MYEVEYLEIVRAWPSARHAREGEPHLFIVLAQIIGPLLSAVAFLHSRGVMHRDIKPENLVVNSAGVLKVRIYLLRPSPGGDARKPAAAARGAAVFTAQPPSWYHRGTFAPSRCAPTRASQ